MRSNQAVRYQFSNIQAPFGMGNGLHCIKSLLPRLNLVVKATSCGTYRFGFNGQEKDDELKGEGNSLDFGGRIYDSRLGRWLSLDPLADKFPGWSPYKAFLDNPNVYADPTGESEIFVLKVLDQNTGKVLVFTYVSEKDVVYRDDKSKTSAIFSSPTLGSVKIDYYDYYDKLNVTTIVVKDGKPVSTTTESSLVNKRATKGGGNETFDLTPTKSWLEGDGGTQPGGIYFYSEGGGASPTKFKSINDVPMVDAELILDVMGGLTKADFASLPKGLDAIPDLINNVKEMYGLIPPEKERTTEPFTIQQYDHDGNSATFPVSAKKSAADSAKVVQESVKNAKGATVKVNGKKIN